MWSWLQENIVFAVLWVFAAWLAVANHLLRRKNKQLSLRATEAQAVMISMQEEVENADELLKQAKLSFDIEVRKKEEFSGKIAEVLAERDVWRKLYFSEAEGHSNAQNLMMGTIEFLRVKLEKLGKPVRLNQAIEDVYGENKAFHGKDARAEMAAAAEAGKLIEAAAAKERELREKRLKKGPPA